MEPWSRLRRFLCSFHRRGSGPISERDFVEAVGGKWTGKWTMESLLPLQSRRGRWRMNLTTWEGLREPPKIYGFEITLDDRLPDNLVRFDDDIP